MFKSRGSLERHRRLVGTLRMARATRGDRSLASLGKRHIIKVSYGRPIGSSSAKLLAIRSLHVGDGRIVQKVRGLLRTNQSRGRTRHHFRHQTGRRSHGSARRMLGRATCRPWSDPDLLHESEQMLSLAGLRLFACKLSKRILVYGTCVILAKIKISGRR
jgi:hypothetical protein